MSSKVGTRTLAYKGVRAPTPPNVTTHSIDPTTKNYFNFVIGDIWINRGTTAAPLQRIWILVAKPEVATGTFLVPTAIWVLLVNGGGGPLISLTASDATISFPALGNITFPDQVIVGSGNVDSNLQSNVNPNLGPNFTFNLKPSIRWPNTNATLTQGAILIGGNGFMHARGTANTFLGNTAGNPSLTVVSAVQNTGIGNAALQTITTGSSNTAVGSASQFILTTGTNNSSLGFATLAALTTGNSNVAVGSGALTTLLTGANNIALGIASGASYTGAESNNILINNIGILGESNQIKIGTFGSGAGQQNATFLNGGSVNIPNGSILMPSTTTGLAKGAILIGGNGFMHSFGTANTFLGNATGNTSLTVVSAVQNTGIGNAALQTITTGSSNTAVGSASQFILTTGIDNSSLGFATLAGVTTGNSNVAVGSGALTFLLTGANNIALGTGSGASYTGAEGSNILVANIGILGESHTIRVGTNGGGAGQQNRCFIAGIRGITTGVNDAIAVLIDSAHQLGTVSSSERYKDNIQDMGNESSIIMDLRPVTFTYKKFPDCPAWGLIAEEVDEIFPQLVVYNDEGQPDTVKYHELVPLLLNEIQKLNARIEKLEKINN